MYLIKLIMAAFHSGVPVKRGLVLCVVALWIGLQRHLHVTRSSLMLLITPVLFLPFQTKMSNVLQYNTSVIILVTGFYLHYHTIGFTSSSRSPSKCNANFN